MDTTTTNETALDLTDRQVREMAKRNHTPEEMWTNGGALLSVHCSTCAQSWPCATVVCLREFVEPF